MAMSMRTLPVAVASQSKQAMQPLRCSLFRGVSLRQSLSTPVQGKRQYRCSRANKQLATRAFFGTGASNAGTIYEYKVKDIDGRDQNLSKYKGKALLIVNVASQCGFTPQYKELVELYGQYKKQGLEILAFPCNQFGSQEPGDNAQVKAFASKQGAKFPIMAKVDVNGGNAEPLYGFLKSKQGGLLISDIKWNFTKFLTDKEGNVVKRYGSTTTPLEIAKDIEAVL